MQTVSYWETELSVAENKKTKPTEFSVGFYYACASFAKTYAPALPRARHECRRRRRGAAQANPGDYRNGLKKL